MQNTLEFSHLIFGIIASNPNHPTPICDGLAFILTLQKIKILFQFRVCAKLLTLTKCHFIYSSCQWKELHFYIVSQWIGLLFLLVIPTDGQILIASQVPIVKLNRFIFFNFSKLLLHSSVTNPLLNHVILTIQACLVMIMNLTSIEICICDINCTSK